MSKFIKNVILFVLAIITVYSVPINALAANCDPSGGIDPNTWSLIEQYTCDPNNPGNAGEEWVCFNNAGTPNPPKFSNDVSDLNRCPITQANQSCSYAENCDAGGGLASGQHSCTGTIQNGTCFYDPSVAPNCSACQPINNPTPSPTPNIPQFPSKEEQAVYNQCGLSSTVGICPKVENNQNIFQKFINTISSLFLGRPQNPIQLVNQGGTLHNNNFPSELTIPIKDQDPVGGADTLKQSLGTDNSFYSINFPPLHTGSNITTSPISSQTKDILQREQDFEHANFPDSVSPITGQ